MKLSVFQFSAKQLQSIHSDHLGFIIASSQCCNELTCIKPYIIFEQNIDEANEAEKSLILIRFFTMVRFQIAKIFEYRELCNRYVGKIRVTFPAMAESLQDETKTISRAIKNAKWAETIRNKAAFHFDESYALSAINQLPEDTSLSFIAGDIRGLTAFHFSDKAIVQSMFIEAGSGDENAGRTIVLRWCIDLEAQIATFHSNLIKRIFKQHGIFQNISTGEIRDSWCAKPGSIGIPLSTLKE